jgi:energy-converting hydrogenase Eha subunit G
MLVPFISSGLSSKGTPGLNTGSLVLFERLGTDLSEVTIFEGLDVVLAM